MSTTSNTYVTVLSAAVTVGEVGDAVLVHVRAGFSTGDFVPAVQSRHTNCTFRLTRGTTELRFFTSRRWQPKFLWDYTDVDSPPVGTHTYSVANAVK